MKAKLLFALLVPLSLVHEGRGASVPVADSAPAALSEASSRFYDHHGHQCKKCPPGFRVDQHCTLDTETTCRRCDKDTYSKDFNPFNMCFSCKPCRQLDQVELRPCTATSDTQCACKTGTYCSPGLPCETCYKCTPRCPEGEQMVKPCNSTSNIECVPFATSPTPPAGSKGYIIWIICVFLILVLLILALAVCWKKFCCRTGALSRESPPTLWCSKRLWRNFSQGQQEMMDNQRNWKGDLESSSTSRSQTPSTLRTPETMPLHPAAPSEEVTAESHKSATERERDLLPANGKDTIDALRASFDIFIKQVPVKEWLRYMRALDLTEHEIACARSDKDLYEQQFQMLRTWLDKMGREASLSILLKTLRDNGLRGVEGIIIKSLISQKLYAYEE